MLLPSCHSSSFVPLQVEFNGLYSSANVAITATHTHSSPAGFLGHLLYHLTSLGFIQQSFDAMLDGILEVGVDNLLGITNLPVSLHAAVIQPVVTAGYLLVDI